MKSELTRLLQTPDLTPIHIKTSAGFGATSITTEISKSLGIHLMEVRLSFLEEFDVRQIETSAITKPTVLVLSEFNRAKRNVQMKILDFIFAHKNTNLKIVMVSHKSDEKYLEDSNPYLGQCVNLEYHWDFKKEQIKEKMKKEFGEIQ